MRIEDITKEKLQKANDRELIWLRVRFMQIWNKHFQGNVVKSANGLGRNELMTKYGCLLTVMKNRSLDRSTEDIDRQYFAKVMEIAKVGIDVTQLKEISISKNCVFINEDFNESEKIEVIILSEESYRDEYLEKAITEMFEEQIDKQLVFKYQTSFEGRCIPLFHGILQPVSKIEKIDIKHVEVVEDTQEGDKKFEYEILFIPVEKGEEHIVYGIVYEPDTKDSQGDMASEDEIRKAAYQFMEEVQVFKVNHKGKQVKTKVLENYIAPVSFSIGKKKVKKGSWVLVTRVLDKKLWEEIKGGNITGYSMAGYAKVG